MDHVTVNYREGGSFLKRNVGQQFSESDGVHLFTANMDLGLNQVTVVDSQGYYVREYNTQGMGPKVDTSKKSACGWDEYWKAVQGTKYEG